MANKPKKDNLYPATLRPEDFIGSLFEYSIFAIKSNHPLLVLANEISHLIGKDIPYIGDYFLKESQKNAQFCMSHLLLDDETNTNITLLENKTTLFDQNFIAKSEIGQSFHTLSLFDDIYYIFNPNGLHLFDWDLLEIDYLLILSSENTELIKDLETKINPISQCKLYNVTELLFSDDKKDKDRKTFVLNLLSNIEGIANDFDNKRERLRFVSNPTISIENVDITRGSYHSEINPIYIQYLTEDQTFD